ncbi:MAG TPA: hypothetical protein P5059_01605 [Candidatus Dojkabacteria bacterium]|nr:hypothetical protein [Candidatus Dojkabacteria bacterium]
MIQIAEEISKKEGFKEISITLAVGTREYYKKRGFKNASLYIIKSLNID